MTQFEVLLLVYLTDSDVCEKSISTIAGFNKLKVCKSCFRDPNSRFKGFDAGGVKVDDKILTFIIAWHLKPRGSNHDLLNEGNLIFLYALKRKIREN